ncbi:MAG: peptidoglycan DD-metalloendopeptidase family protein [Gemmiger sp.]|nr:peptidoglycan DD-metalloendopeptidase family protein [Gemmiger sp.]
MKLFVKKAKKILSVFITLALALAMAFSAASPALADDTQKELEAKKNQIQAELDKTKEELAAIQSEKADAEAEKSKLQVQTNQIVESIGVISQQIADTQTKIDAKQVEIDQKQVEVEAKQAEIDQRWGDFKERMVAMQHLNDRGSIALLSTASNLYELLTFSTTLEQIANKDQQVIEDMEAEYAALDAQKQDLENAKTEMEAVRASYEEQNNQLQNKKAEFTASLQQKDATITQAEAEAELKSLELDEKTEEFNKASNELDSYLRQMIAQMQTKYIDAPISCSLNFIRPLDSYKYISCQYGSNGHGGTDFAAPGNTPIRTVASGVVTVSTYHNSYGNYVMVYHGTDDSGNTYATLYAHMISSPSVSVGQSVSQGDILGYVGSTGNSTGNHLHLELRVNGARTNPLLYVPQ